MHRYSADPLTRYPPIDFDILCPFWDFFENDGLSTNIVELAHLITSPVLLVGSGQGIVARALINIGHSVTSIDKSAIMQAYAKARRGIVGIIGSIGSVRVGNRYSTTIINTGVITSLSLKAGIIDEINGLVHRSGRCKSMILIAYFRHCPFIDQCDKLGLFGHASNNHIFWLGRESLQVTSDILFDSGIDKQLVESVLHSHPTEIVKHRHLIVSIGNRYLTVFRRSPIPFLRRHAGFYPYNLTTHEEDWLRSILKSKYEIICEITINLNTNVIVCQKL